ncbi:MAG TPA: ABC transporter permease [Thermodesulfobacteriota bacterium]|jgi:putative ABC transport system permease protein|nr:ABC transporter permease [Thermodesulfobacteriota bacterium]
MITLISMSVGLAFTELRRNKMRSLLTMLGVIIGVGAVITMVSLGQGASSSIQDEISSLGTNMILVLPGSTTQGGVRAGSGTAQTLTVEDAKAIEKQIPAIGAVTYSIRDVSQVIYGNQNWSTAIYGVTPEYLIIRNWALDAGSFFTKRDLDRAANVAVLGRTVVKNLFFPGDYPVGKIIRIKNSPFRVIGVLRPKGQSAFGTDQDDVVLIPFTTAERRVFGAFLPGRMVGTVGQSGVQLGGQSESQSLNQSMKLPGRVGSIQVSTVSEEAIQVVMEQIRDILRTRHKLQPGQEDDFTIRSLEDIATAAEATTRTLTILLLSIASISLIVGGVGIMNIMLVSVTERTKEIGIRMAVGAKRKDILLQFLIETLTLSLIGGVIGIFIGILSSEILSLSAGWPTLISVEAIFLSFIFAAIVGVFFGFYPANKASNLDPIEALRHE